MAKDLLLVTTDANFAKVLLQGLGKEGYRVHVAKGKGEAVVRADEENCTLAFLDMDLGYKAVSDIGRSLRTLNANIDLVLFSGEDSLPALDEIGPWTSLRKSYYLPDLLTMLNDNSSPLSKPSKPITDPRMVQTPSSGLPWLQDETKAAQHLTRLTLESSAQAALITRGAHLWAYAGQLSQGAAKELAMTITRHWDGQKGSDLLRFVRLEATKAEHMLYATRLADDVVLALVFDAETPFSTIRTQAGQLVNLLSTAVSEGMEPPIEQQKHFPASYDAPTQELDDESGSELDIPDISEILSDVPPPTPERGMIPLPDEEEWSTRPSSSRSNKFSRESSPAVRVNDLLMAHQDNEQTVESRVGGIEDFDATMPSKSRQRPETPLRRPMPGELDETRPHSITEVASRVMLEPIAPGLYNLTYACLLVPRFSSHYLTGDMSDRLSEWLPQICIAFGWRLEYLAVRPEYVQWVVNVPPATSPGYLMRIVRQQTSEKIFTEFTRMKKENPSGDFWAPGYLIMGGTQPHPPQLVKDYIKQTRTRQGYSQPRR
jgi:REP element-mobilizing transposase RayT/CheY-like chemotaxis protein